jgi:malonyl CoA-acyl carrier protein transacylase
VKRAVVFPGQGTQYVGMGADLAKEFPEVRRLHLHPEALLGAACPIADHPCLFLIQARRVFEEVDEALGFRLSQIMWDGAPVPTLLIFTAIALAAHFCPFSGLRMVC